MCMFSTLVNTFPQDFWCFVGSLLGGIGVRKNLDKVLLSRRGRIEHLLEESSESLLIRTVKLMLSSDTLLSSAGCTIGT